MLKLQPLIARLVDDVLRLVREAAMDDLRRLVVSDAERSLESPPVKRTSGSTSGATSGARRDVPTRRRGALHEPAQRSHQVAKNAAENPDRAPPPAVAEITDPEALLAGAAPKPAPPLALEYTRVSESESDGPASAVRPLPLVSPVRLMGNETLARVSSSGVVIRRARRA
jgi:hypothetical protein